MCCCTVLLYKVYCGNKVLFSRGNSLFQWWLSFISDNKKWEVICPHCWEHETASTSSLLWVIVKQHPYRLYTASTASTASRTFSSKQTNRVSCVSCRTVVVVVVYWCPTQCTSTRVYKSPGLLCASRLLSPLPLFLSPPIAFVREEPFSHIYI